MTKPIIAGAESFQVLHGVDGTNGSAHAGFSAIPADSVPHRYLAANHVSFAYAEPPLGAAARLRQAITFTVRLRNFARGYHVESAH